ncbi:hypothetical protein [Caminibacter pacificus]|uniref:Lipopolysaccharide-assembly n=1 Tax=Caminibacter pacificus TaxID=1424653 RepID=A0AAJ4RDE8_9BACT|nr:hypothetical protein [Caminibacter pacificus]ROR40223.1 hypothetical protein EDC58_1212 [Caminibacter pacificus]
MKKFSVFLLFFLIGCGYKPSTLYQNKILGDNINAKVVIDPKNPRETIFLTDAVRDAIYTVFDKNLCFSGCDTTLEVNPSASSLIPLDYDENGYPILYRSKVVLKVTLKDKSGKIRNYTVTGTYDFNVAPQSVLTDQIKLDAYKKASINALNRLFAKITKDGAEQ